MASPAMNDFLLSELEDKVKQYQTFSSQVESAKVKRADFARGIGAVAHLYPTTTINVNLDAVEPYFANLSQSTFPVGDLGAVIRYSQAITAHARVVCQLTDSHVNNAAGIMSQAGKEPITAEQNATMSELLDEIEALRLVLGKTVKLSEKQSLLLSAMPEVKRVSVSQAPRSTSPAAPREGNAVRSVTTKHCQFTVNGKETSYRSPSALAYHVFDKQGIDTMKAILASKGVSDYMTDWDVTLDNGKRVTCRIVEGASQ